MDDAFFNISSFVADIVDDPSAYTSSCPDADFTSTANRFFMEQCPMYSGGADSHFVAETLFNSCLALAPDAVRQIPPIFVGSPTTTYIVDGKQVRIPNTSDVWYICVGLSILPPWSYTTQGDWYVNQGKSANVKKLLKPFIATIGSLSPLRIPRTAVDIETLKNSGIETIKEARYENMQGGASCSWPSRGPECMNTSGVDKEKVANDFCGYIAFPVGPIGPAVRTISLAVEHITKSMVDADAWHTGTYCKNGFGTVLVGGMFPPRTYDNKCYGLHLYEDYAKRMNDQMEYPAKDFWGLPRHLRHTWLRYYLKKDRKFPIPGRFVGLIIKPENTFCWWYQKTSPILYSGCFFETAYYTSGKIVGILKESAKLNKEVGNVYKVNIRGTVLYMQSLDFYKYELGDEVCILKKVGSQYKAFSWLEMQDLDLIVQAAEAAKADDKKGTYTLFTDYVIIPVEFYKKELEK